jgi:hypothetical protein
MTMMRAHTIRPLAAVLLAATAGPCLALGPQPEPPDRPALDQGAARTPTDAGLSRERIGRLREAGKTLRALADERAPAGLAPDQAREAARYSAWLRSASGQLLSLADHWDKQTTAAEHTIARTPPADSHALAAATQQMQEMQMSFNLQYLRLQNKIAHENRQFTMVSNIMKNRHDTAKNAINNIR